jgi:hypothetical protein
VVALDEDEGDTEVHWKRFKLMPGWPEASRPLLLDLSGFACCKIAAKVIGARTVLARRRLKVVYATQR